MSSRRQTDQCGGYQNESDVVPTSPLVVQFQMARRRQGSRSHSHSHSHAHNAHNGQPHRAIDAFWVDDAMPVSLQPEHANREPPPVDKAHHGKDWETSPILLPP